MSEKRKRLRKNENTDKLKIWEIDFLAELKKGKK
jgi:hypothetical protein